MTVNGYATDVAPGSRTFGLKAEKDREIACPAKGGQRIAAGRCVDAQEQGCFCPAAFGALRGYEAIAAEDGELRGKERVRLSALRARADGFQRQAAEKQWAGAGLTAENERRARAKRGEKVPSSAPVVPVAVAPTAAAVPAVVPDERTCSEEGCAVLLRPDNTSGCCSAHRNRNASRDAKIPGPKACKHVFRSGVTCGRAILGSNKSGLCQFCSRGMREDHPGRFLPPGRPILAGRTRCERAGCKLFAVKDGCCGPHAEGKEKYIRTILAEERKADEAKKTPAPAPVPPPVVSAPPAPPPTPADDGLLHDPIHKTTGVYRSRPLPAVPLPAYEALPLGWVIGLLEYLEANRTAIDEGRVA